ncbi:MAG TPA: GtrA family protein [Solirubrobacteraceae bacterium]|nr:GtrA family protein [Solirubrobacteraceae bacterium]
MQTAERPRGAIPRFLITGVLNTVVTGALLVIAAHWIKLEVAYTIVFMFGLAFTTVATGRYVFRSHLSVYAATRFVAWYLCVYLVGVAVLHLLGHDVSHVLAAAAVLTVTGPLNFLGGSRAFLGRSSVRTQAELRR